MFEKLPATQEYWGFAPDVTDTWLFVYAVTLGVKRWLDYKPVHWFIVWYNAANNIDLRHAPNILTTKLHSSQKPSKTTSSFGVETIELSDLIINMELPPDALGRYKYMIIHIGQDPYTMPPEIWVSYDNATTICPLVTYPDIYNYLISTPSPYTGNELKAYTIGSSH